MQQRREITSRNEPEFKYNPVHWCMVCGWSTDDPQQTQCDCDHDLDWSS